MLTTFPNLLSCLSGWHSQTVLGYTHPSVLMISNELQKKKKKKSCGIHSFSTKFALKICFSYNGCTLLINSSSSSLLQGTKPRQMTATRVTTESLNDEKWRHIILVKEQTNIIKIQGTPFFCFKSLQDHYILSNFPRNCPQSLERCYLEQVLIYKHDIPFSASLPTVC